jgi:hypothetical protein
MKILHIWDQAGVACILAKHQRMLGHDVMILKRAGYDPFGIFEFYRESLLDIDGKSFIKNAIKRAAEFDVVHVHSLYKIIPDLRRKYRDKILILHFHGSEARKAPKDPIQEQAIELSDAVIGSTEDLAQYVGSEMTYIPNPVDTDHFKRPTISLEPKGKAFTFKTTGADMEWIIQYLRNNSIDSNIEIIDRQANPIPYLEMPQVLGRYSTYVDLKHVGGTLLRAPSKTAIECLACGLQVLNHRLEIMEHFPEEHRPEKLAAQILDIYRKR